MIKRNGDNCSFCSSESTGDLGIDVPCPDKKAVSQTGNGRDYPSEIPESESRFFGKAAEAETYQLCKKVEKNFDGLCYVAGFLVSRQVKAVASIRHCSAFLSEEQPPDAEKIRAARLIARDGPLGIEKVSEGIVDFAQLLYEEGFDCKNSLKDAVRNGFRKVQESQECLLPPVSCITFDEIKRKIDERF